MYLIVDSVPSLLILFSSADKKLSHCSAVNSDKFSTSGNIEDANNLILSELPIPSLGKNPFGSKYSFIILNKRCRKGLTCSTDNLRLDFGTDGGGTDGGGIGGTGDETEDDSISTIRGLRPRFLLSVFLSNSESSCRVAFAGSELGAKVG